MSNAETASRFGFDAIGTHWQIETDEPLSQDLRRLILDRIERFDATYSRFRPDSLVSRIAAATDGGRFAFPDDSLALFGLYERLHAVTDGAVDPLVGRELELLGYDATYTLRPAPDSVRAAEHARGRPIWAADISRNGRRVITRRALVIDVGAVGKGYLVDLVSDQLRAAGHTDFVVDASGDLRHSGPRATRVGLEHPFDRRQVIGVAEVRDQALCASGVSSRSWGDGLHHVLDARTGVPVDQVVATWVVAQEAALADGLATALFFTEPQRLAESFDFTYVRVRSDGRAELSPDFPGELFTRP
ncbi:FAD:protein FMN transferase [Streptomyces phaeochromogenes]|uniref:FAD:protein FMN transferase n=1 Tax=Streptomyces phaeochromogenes TaxID=1923 RepID=UPI002E0DDC99|nr:FAD:protein FMN transferase [Streptomyces phaeochromogenes]